VLSDWNQLPVTVVNSEVSISKVTGCVQSMCLSGCREPLQSPWRYTRVKGAVTQHVAWSSGEIWTSDFLAYGNVCLSHDCGWISSSIWPSVFPFDFSNYLVVWHYVTWAVSSVK
jgi:hypothetical protein